MSISDIVGPSQWGLRADKSLIRNEAKETLEYLFHIDSLDVYLPLLVDTSPQASTCIAQLLGAAVRTSEHRKAITDWLPPEDRLKEVKTRRGWEKTSTTNANASSRQGGWVARNLTILLLSRDSKVCRINSSWSLLFLSFSSFKKLHYRLLLRWRKIIPPSLMFLANLRWIMTVSFHLYHSCGSHAF